MNSDLKNRLLAAFAISAIAASVVWIFRGYFEHRGLTIEQHRQIGEAMAQAVAPFFTTERTNRGRLLIVAIDPKNSPAMKAQLDAFEHTVTNVAKVKIKAHEYLQAAPGEKYRIGSGMSARRYVRLLGKNVNSDAVISFIGVPEDNPEEFAQWTNHFPVFIAEALERARARRLLTNGVLDAAIVPRAAKSTKKSAGPQLGSPWFLQHYEVLTTNAIPAARP